MDAETHLTMQPANRVLKLDNEEDVAEDPVRLALREWQEAATAWTDLYRRVHVDTNAGRSGYAKKLRRLEKRLNKAADNYEKVQSDGDWIFNRRPSS